MSYRTVADRASDRIRTVGWKILGHGCGEARGTKKSADNDDEEA